MVDLLIWGIICVTNLGYFRQINGMNFCLFNMNISEVEKTQKYVSKPVH